MQDYTDAAVRAGLMTPDEDRYEHFHTEARGCPGLGSDEGLQWALKDTPLEPWADNVRFGFVDEEQAREWFPPCMADALNANALTLTRWEVPEEAVAIGDRQVVFDRDAATLIDRLPVEALYEPTYQLPLPLAA
jgi:hypothetical protein